MANEVRAVIGKDITIKGEIEGGEDLLIEGVVEGTIHLDAELIVGPEGQVRAQVEAALLTVEGALDGEVSVSEVARLAPGCRMTGVLTSGRVVIEDGANFTGRLDMDTGLVGAVGGKHG